MNKFTLNLSPSKPLRLSAHAMEIISKTFEEHHLSVVKKSLDKEMLFEISFDENKETLKKRIAKVKEKARKAKIANPTDPDQLEYKVFMDVAKGLKIELNAINANFVVRITEDQVIIETRCHELIPLIVYESYFSTIMYQIREAYSKMGQEILLIEKNRKLFEQLQRLSERSYDNEASFMT